MVKSSIIHIKGPKYSSTTVCLKILANYTSYTAYKKLPLKIFSVNVTKSTVSLMENVIFCNVYLMFLLSDDTSHTAQKSNSSLTIYS